MAENIKERLMKIRPARGNEEGPVAEIVEEEGDMESDDGYMIVQDGEPEELARKVSAYMKKGWRPFGNPYFSSWHNQAMIRETT